MLVIDASIAAKLYLAEPGSEAARATVPQDEDLLMPAHGLAEVGEIVSRKLRAGLLDSLAVPLILAELSSKFRSVPLAPLLDPALRIAAETGASVYDTLYVALAHRWSCPLVTADRRLAVKMRDTRSAALIELLDSR